MIESQEVMLKAKLKEVFGFDNYRGNQEAIIQNLLNNHNTFVLMPTGAGKSMCYQLPAITKEGTAIVISPLIALMKNQVDQMNAFGINARFLNSTLNKSEITQVRRETLSGDVKLLYVAPESLTKEDNINFLQKARISFVAIDEAHCISEWGHDFRPEYRKIKAIINQLDSTIPLIALTATATPKVQQDIQKNLNMEDADVFVSSFNRVNLYYEVRPKEHAKKQLIKFVKENKGKSGIIYCLSRKKVEEIAQFLKVNDIKAAPYHAGLDGQVRMKNQDGFLNEDIDVIVATIAFGMGIDKPDVRFVVHYDAPKSIEGYYQETGRAGRDGLEGKCLMYYSYNDILKLEKFNKDKSVTERENARLLLDEIAAYAESSVCRRRQLLHYFGEEFEEDCGFCDNCLHPKEKFDGRKQVKHVLEAVVQTEQRFDIKHIVDVVSGSETAHIKSYGHDKLESYGKGGDETTTFWRSVVRQALMLGLLYKDIENVGLLLISDKGKAFLKKPYEVILSRDHDYNTDGVEEEESEKTAARVEAADEALFELLKGLRKKVAREKGLPPYVIFQDPSLEEMATVYPQSIDDLKKIIGVGESKAKKFGQPFLDAIDKYVKENDILTASDVLVKSTGFKSKNKIFIISQIDRKIDLEEIAETKGMAFELLIEEIENICYSGTSLNLDYYIDHMMDPDRTEEIYDYFMGAESDDIDLALEELGDDEFSEDEIRLVRIKFMSEHAH
ncbi:MAG: DNA helicase RecQ [Cyclobacteriaceae bacterium]